MKKYFFSILILIIFFTQCCYGNEPNEPQNYNPFVGSWKGYVDGADSVECVLELFLDFTETTITLRFEEFQYGAITDDETGDVIVLLNHNLRWHYWENSYSTKSIDSIGIWLLDKNGNLAREHFALYSLNANNDTLNLINLLFWMPHISIWDGEITTIRDIDIIDLFPSIHNITFTKK